MEPQPISPPTTVEPIAITSKPKWSWMLGALILLVLVGTGGIFLGKQMASPTPTPIVAVPTVAADPTASWKTYSGSNYSFKYPADWSAAEKCQDYCPTQIDIKNPTKTVVIGLSTEQAVYGGINPPVETDTLQIRVDGTDYSAVEYENSYVDLKVSKNNTDYYILFGTGYPAGADNNKSLGEYKSNKNTIITILSTLKFTTPVGSANTQLTYTDPTLGITVEYPTAWKVTTGKDAYDNYYFKLTKTSATKAKYSGRLLPEIYIGGDIIYSTSGGICANQECQNGESLQLSINNRTYPTIITKGSVGGDLDFYAFLIPASKFDNKFAITASYLNDSQKQEIMQILSSLKINN